MSCSQGMLSVSTPKLVLRVGLLLADGHKAEFGLFLWRAHFPCLLPLSLSKKFEERYIVQIVALTEALSDGGLEVLAFPVVFFSPQGAGGRRNEKGGGHSEGDELIVISCDELQLLCFLNLSPLWFQDISGLIQFRIQSVYDLKDSQDVEFAKQLRLVLNLVQGGNLSSCASLFMF